MLSQLPEDHIWDENLFQEALCTIALNYCSSMACQEQKRFMKRHLGIPSGQMTITLLSRIQQFNRYLPYLPGAGNKFDADDVREMVYNALLTFVHTIIATSDYKWYDENRSDAKVFAYIDCLLVISALAQGKKWESNYTSKKQVTYTSKKNTFNKKSFKRKSSSQNKIKCVQCKFCNMKGHEEIICRFKLKAIQEAQHETKQKSQQKPNATSSEAFAVEYVEMPQ
jgi:hypothetical protein